MGKRAKACVGLLATTALLVAYANVRHAQDRQLQELEEINRLERQKQNAEDAKWKVKEMLRR